MAKKWYPVIDITACIECGTCSDFCEHGVYDKAKSPVPKVIYPEGCIDHCHGCGNQCPAGAINYVGDDTGWVPPALGKSNSSGCSCGCDCGITEAESHKKKLYIEYLYLDLHTCDRCIGTDAVLEETISALRPALELAGYEISYQKIEMTTAQIAQQYMFLSSPTIRVNGNDIFGYIKENNCGCCGEIAGPEVECRVFEWDGKQYEVPTTQVMADAILHAVSKTGSNTDCEYMMPENLRRFYDGKAKKENPCGCGGNCC